MATATNDGSGEQANENDLTVVDVGTPPPLDLADDLRLLVGGILGADEPYNVRVEYTPGSGRNPDAHPMISETFSVTKLGSEVARERFVAQAVALYPGESEFADALSEALSQLATAVADGHFIVVDSRVRAVVDVTARVEYDPEASKQWRVHFDAESSPEFSTLEFSASDWASHKVGTAVSGKIPRTIPAPMFHKNPERWRAVRSIWQRMATDADINGVN